MSVNELNDFLIDFEMWFKYEFLKDDVIKLVKWYYPDVLKKIETYLKFQERKTYLDGLLNQIIVS